MNDFKLLRSDYCHVTQQEVRAISGSRNFEPETWNPEPRTPNPEPLNAYPIFI